MTKRMLIMILGVILLVAGIGFVVFRNILQQIAQGSAPQPPVVVTAMRAGKQEWQPQLNAVGTLRAVRGVDVTTEIAGLVREVRVQIRRRSQGGRRCSCSSTPTPTSRSCTQLEAAADLAQTDSTSATRRSLPPRPSARRNSTPMQPI